jgi:hypothetical protein
MLSKRIVIRFLGVLGDLAVQIFFYHFTYDVWNKFHSNAAFETAP